VSFSSLAEAEKAVAKLNNTEFQGRQLKVEVAKPPVPREEVAAQKSSEQKQQRPRKKAPAKPAEPAGEKVINFLYSSSNHFLSTAKA
jgi:RNA recognition motif-containing protein